jgi:hypothetical protein
MTITARPAKNGRKPGTIEMARKNAAQVTKAQAEEK